MKIDISKVKVTERIRKTVNRIDELAADITERGLLNPITVMLLESGEYQLLAGLRRLRAAQSLGWTEIEVNSITPKDAESALRVEISENEQREPFTYSEKLDYGRQLERIESAKALERKVSGKPADEQADLVAKRRQGSRDGKTGAIVGKKLGMSETTYNRLRYVGDNAPEILPKIDSGERTITGAYNEAKAVKSGLTAEEQNALIKQSRDSDKRIRNSYSDPTIILTPEEKKLKKQRETAVAESPQAKRLWSEWEERKTQNADTAPAVPLPQKAVISPKMEKLHEQETERIRKLREYEALPPEGKIAELQRQIEEQRVRAVRAENELEDFKYKTHNQIYHRDCKLENLHKRNDELNAALTTANARIDELEEMLNVKTD